jgi:8-oxo-dGTP diphosphatase
MTTTEQPTLPRQVYFHDPTGPTATSVVPSVFVAVRGPGDRLLLVRRCDSGAWELPGGRVDVGENAIEAAVRETAEEAGVRVVVTGLVGLFSDPGVVIRSRGGDVRQQFAVLFRARVVAGVPHPDLEETSEAAWVPLGDIPGLPMEPSARIWIAQALAPANVPHLA